MKNVLYILLLITTLVLAIMTVYEFSGNTAELITYMCGFISGMSLVLTKLNNKSITLNSYKRELEKESITSDENSAKVKVLESKIEVLEKECLESNILKSNKY